MSDLYIGLMSGTSLDGIDAALADFSSGKCKVLGFHYIPFSEQLKQQLNQLSQPDHPIYLHDYGRLDQILGHLFAKASQQLLDKAQIKPEKITAIGCHGLTTHHAPTSDHPFSLQIGDPNVIAEKTGITTISDLRRRDMAVGGQGAPLVPAFHHYFFAEHLPVCVVNIGGISNISILKKSGEVLGFDTGPGNTLMDYWINKIQHQPYDKNGAWAASGHVCKALLSHLKKDTYFQHPPPKSTGKEYFSARWLEQKISSFNDLQAADIQATLCQLTADSISEAIAEYGSECQKIILCGGGSHNHHLKTLLRQNLNRSIETSDTYGIAPDQVEAIAFAWLARQTIHRLPGNLCSATGAKKPVVLGGIYPGKSMYLGGK